LEGGGGGKKGKFETDRTHPKKHLSDFAESGWTTLTFRTGPEQKIRRLTYCMSHLLQSKRGQKKTIGESRKKKLSIGTTPPPTRKGKKHSRKLQKEE